MKLELLQLANETDKVTVVILAADVWKKLFSENAHLAVFKENKPKELDRINFALLALMNDTPCGYMTCRELSETGVYVQYGGVFENAKNTIYSYSILNKCLTALGKYNFIQMYIENSNLVMLKMAMKVGFRVVGIRNFEGSILLEHVLNRGK